MTLYVLTTIQQFALFGAVVVAVGCSAWSLVILPGAGRIVAESERAGLVLVERKVASVGVLAAAILVGAWLLRGTVQLMAFRDSFVPLSEDVSFLLFDLFWGTVWMGQGVLVLLLVPALMLARRSLGSEANSVGSPRRVTVWRGVTGVLTLGIVASLSLSSHAMGVDSGRSFIVTADALHLLAVGTWIGSLTMILTVGRAGGRPLYAAQLQSFSPMAITSVATLTVMGTVLAWTHLVTLQDLWTETYGRVLSAKVLTAGVVFALGFLNWRNGLPSVETEHGAAGVQRRAAFEVSAAVVVLLLTAFLVHSPLP